MPTFEVLYSSGKAKPVCGDCHRVNVRFSGGRHTCEGCLAKRRWKRFVAKVARIMDQIKEERAAMERCS